MKKLALGILAHVDAGKTTLSEGLLYAGGCIGQLGRVDHGNAFLDNDALERERGITIFSKLARLELPEAEITLVDTPGHVDFSTEMERTLQILDYAVLVISGTDGVQSHTETLWRLLRRYEIPTFLFINKMDLAGADREALLHELQTRLSESCVDFGRQTAPDFQELLSLCDEGLLDSYLTAGRLKAWEITAAIAARKIFPCRFGSALKLEGVQELLEDICKYTRELQYPDTMGLRAYKISRDVQGTRLTWMKVTGGSLKVKTLLSGDGRDGHWEEKVDQIRLYSGAKYRTVEQVEAGTVCAVTGLGKTVPGQGFGLEPSAEPPSLQPVLTYQLLLPPECNLPETMRRLAQLEEEDPMLHILWNEQLQEIHVQLMGEVQLEVLQRQLRDRFGLEASFGAGSVVYRETIADTVEGVGHFEPLRHYAEVHLLLQPGERGSGLVFDSACSTDVLELNWQRLILTHLEEKQHLGVLIGAPITDMRITLLTGKASVKHTEGGDFRQATYRAVRQGLMQAHSILLEPYYDFTLRVPKANAGRAMTDLQQMGGVCEAPVQEDDFTVLTGHAPVAAMRDYTVEIAAYTRGRGRLSLQVRGYEPCREQQVVLQTSGYRPENDLDNTPDSVFCAHGAGFVVPWNQVPQYMHLESALPKSDAPTAAPVNAPTHRSSGAYRGTAEEDRELQAIYERTYGAVRRREFIPRKKDVTFDEPGKKSRPTQAALLPEYVLVDGYNIIFSWDELKGLAAESLEAARQSLADILCNYQGYRKCGLILVFDAYKVHNNPGSVEKYHNIHIVYTREAETADMYIEKVTYEMGGKYRVRVATSDGMEQLIILGHGAVRVSSLAFRSEVLQTHTEIGEIVQKYRARAGKGSTIGQILDGKPDRPGGRQHTNRRGSL